MTVSRITTSGLAQDANISPDGKYIVYLEMADDGSRGLYVKQTATGNSIPIVPPTKGNILKNTSFSPDGNFVYYRFYDRIRVCALSGVVRRRHSEESNRALQQRGRRLTRRTEDRLHALWKLEVQHLCGKRGRHRRASPRLAGREQWFAEEGPAWSPDGKTIAIAGGATVDGVDQFRLLGIDAESGAKRDLSPKRWVEAGRVVWMPDGAALALMATERTDEVGAQVWRVGYPSGEASRITNDVQARTEASLGVTADGRTLVTVTEQVLSRIETVPAGGDVSRLTRLTSAEANQEGYSRLRPRAGRARRLLVLRGGAVRPLGHELRRRRAAAAHFRHPRRGRPDRLARRALHCLPLEPAGRGRHYAPLADGH